MIEYIYDKMIEWNMYLVLQLINIIDNSFLESTGSYRLFSGWREQSKVSARFALPRMRGTRVFANIIAPVRYASFFTRADLDRIQDYYSDSSIEVINSVLFDDILENGSWWSILSWRE